MTHISAQAVDQKAFNKVLADLSEVFASQGRKGANIFFSDVLTQTERIMLAKRLAIILLLFEGRSVYWIEKRLKVSSSTVLRYQNDLDQGAYQELQEFANKRKLNEAFWRSIESLLRMGMPEQGRGRWKWLNESAQKKGKA